MRLEDLKLPERGDEPNYLVEAFKSQYNLIALGTAVGFAILSGSFLPMLLAAGLELTVLPLAERWARLRRARNRDQEERKRKELETSELLQGLTHEERASYRTLEVLAGEIRENYKGLDSSSRLLLDDLVRKLQFLLSFYLRMRNSLMRYEAYFSTTDPGEIQERMAELDQEIPGSPERVRQIKARTRSVLVKRLERYTKAQENRQLIEAQTETVQEVLRLLRDQSYSIRDPRSISEQLDGLVSSAEETERGVKDMEDLLEAQHDLMAPLAGVSEIADLEEELATGRPAASAVAQAPAKAPPAPVTQAPPAPVKAAPPQVRQSGPPLPKLKMPPPAPPPPPRKKIPQ